MADDGVGTADLVVCQIVSIQKMLGIIEATYGRVVDLTRIRPETRKGDLDTEIAFDVPS